MQLTNSHYWPQVPHLAKQFHWIWNFRSKFVIFKRSRNHVNYYPSKNMIHIPTKQQQESVWRDQEPLWFHGSCSSQTPCMYVCTCIYAYVYIYIYVWRRPTLWSIFWLFLTFTSPCFVTFGLKKGEVPFSLQKVQVWWRQGNSQKPYWNALFCKGIWPHHRFPPVLRALKDIPPEKCKQICFPFFRGIFAIKLGRQGNFQQKYGSRNGQWPYVLHIYIYM